MNRNVAFTLLLDCNVSGFTELRSIARGMEKEGLPLTVGRWPEDATAEEYAAAIASTFHYMRYACSGRTRGRRPASREILAGAWAGTGVLGKHWMGETLLASGHRGAVHELREAEEADGGREGFLPQAPARRAPHRRWRSAACWCDDIAREGLAEIHRLAVGSRPAGAGAAIRWRRIATIADACHRVPFPAGNPLGVGAIQFPLQLKEGWARTTADGRAWVRQCSASLPHGSPEAIRRVLESEP